MVVAQPRQGRGGRRGGLPVPARAAAEQDSQADVSKLFQNVQHSYASHGFIPVPPQQRRSRRRSAALCKGNTSILAQLDLPVKVGRGRKLGRRAGRAGHVVGGSMRAAGGRFSRALPRCGEPATGQEQAWRAPCWSRGSRYFRCISVPFPLHSRSTPVQSVTHPLPIPD